MRESLVFILFLGLSASASASVSNIDAVVPESDAVVPESTLTVPASFEETSTRGTCDAAEGTTSNPTTCYAWCPTKAAAGTQTWETLCGWSKCSTCCECNHYNGHDSSGSIVAGTVSLTSSLTNGLFETGCYKPVSEGSWGYCGAPSCKNAYQKKDGKSNGVIALMDMLMKELQDGITEA